MLYEFELGHNATELNLNWGIMPQKQLKHLLCERWRHCWSPDGSRNFTQVARTSTIRQDQVGLKAWILRTWSKPEWQICQVTPGDYQASLASHSPMGFITFTDLAKSFGTAKLCLILPKYCNTFDSSKYFPILFEFFQLLFFAILITMYLK